MRFAATQAGLLTRAQAQKWLSERQVHWRLKTGAWVRVLPTVFRVEGASQSWQQNVLAIALWARKNFAFSHRTAARMHGLEPFAEVEALDVTVKRHLEVDAKVAVHRIKVFTKAELTTIDELSVTSMARTLVDLASLPDVDDKTLERCVQQALSQRKVTLAELKAMLKRAKRTRGCPRLRAIVHQLEGGDGLTESELEDAVVEVLEMAELPMPEKQRTVVVGGRLRRMDFRYKDQLVVIEADSRAYHSDDKSFEDDRDRRNKLTAKGYVVLQWTWAAIHERPEELLDELCTLLSRR